jgi:hypothetical protein
MIRNRGGVFTAEADAAGEIAGASASEGIARVDPRIRIAVGDRLPLAVDVDRLHFFDVETGEAVRVADGSPVAPERAAQS